MFRLLRLTRTLFLLILIVALAAMSACFVNAGRMLVDPQAREMPRPADAIVVLAGTEADRWLEAYELWREGRAPVIVLSAGWRDAGAVELMRRGIAFPSDADLAREAMTEKMAVPPEAVLIFPDSLDNTAAEAAATRQWAVEKGWRGVIVVTSVPHTRRTSYAMHRALDPHGIDVQVRGSRFDRYAESRWWTSRGSWRWVLVEWPKLITYRMGLGS